MATRREIEFQPVVPTELHVHQDLPAGLYEVKPSALGHRIYVLKRYNDETFLIIKWMQDFPMFHKFIILENGAVNVLTA